MAEKPAPKPRKPKAIKETKPLKRSSLELVFDRQLRDSGITELYIIEHKFHPTRRWRLDYYFPRIQLGLEIQGGTWTNGGHSRGSGVTSDLEKKEALLLAGIRLYELDGGKTGRVMSGHGINILKQLIEQWDNENDKNN
jgi:hypothetical protein